VNRRALRAAVMGALLLSPVALAACSAGQVAQTATQNQNLGSSADVGDLHLRALELPYPTGGVYSTGSSARLLGAVANDMPTEDTLVGIESPDFDGVEVVDPNAAAPAAEGTETTAPAITVPGNGTLFLGNGSGPSVTLVGLSEERGVGEHVDVTFTFERAGEVTVAVPVATPSRDLPRGEEFNFHEDAEGGH
jgi:copper(I)-binding protein